MPRYLIGDILLKMEYGSIPVKSGENLSLFQYEESWNGEEISCVTEIDDLHLDEWECVSPDNNIYQIYRKETEECLVYHWGNLFNAFAVHPEGFSVTFSKEMLAQPELREDWFFSIISFHRQLLQRKACILHSSYVEYEGKALLFTGPSNVGKSTQASIWEQYGGAQIINGDRTLIREKDGQMFVYGYPCCGTSGICVNKTLPLNMIVVLEQANENRIKELSVMEKMRALVVAMEVYPWDRKEIDWAFAVAKQIVKQVPVIKLYCRPDKGAFDVLKQYWEEIENGKSI